MTLHTGCLWVSVTLGRKYRLANVHQLTHTTTHIPLPYISFCNAILSCHKHSFSFIFGKHSCFQWFQLSQNCQQHITALIVTTNHSNESNYTASRIHHMSNMSFVCFQKRNNWRKKKKVGWGGGGDAPRQTHTPLSNTNVWRLVAELLAARTPAGFSNTIKMTEVLPALLITSSPMDHETKLVVQSL